MSEWLTASQWESIDLYEDDEVWEKYLREPETVVNEKLNLFIEPSIQCGRGGVFISDNNGKFDTVEVDFQEWLQTETEMAASSKSQKEYEVRYEKFLLSLIGG